MPSLLFWFSVFLLVYIFVGYPILIRGLAGRAQGTPTDDAFTPRISVVIVAHNEAGRVAQRLENLLSLDYPRDRLEILFASDGSTDDMVERALAYADFGVRVLAFGSRRGKPAVLNEVVPKVQGEIVVLADARQRFDRGALRALAAPFIDPKVGAVSGELILTQNPDEALPGKGLGFYWRYEKFIRLNESRVDSTVGATGAIYALRAHLFERFPEDTLLDDVWLPLRIVRKGFRVRFEPKAKAYDRVAASGREEFTRKVRTLAGNFQLFARERWLLNPWRNRLWFQTVSHKGLRLLIPLLLGTAWVMNAWLLSEHLFYRAAFGAQVLFYGAACAGALLQKTKRRVPLAGIAYTICLLAWATLEAFVSFLSGRQAVTWEKAQRPRKALASARRKPLRADRSAQTHHSRVLNVKSHWR